MSKTTIMVALTIGDGTHRKRVRASRERGGLAIHRNIDRRRIWAVTHIESGRNVMGNLTYRQASRVLEVLSKAHEWAREESVLVREVSRGVMIRARMFLMERSHYVGPKRLAVEFAAEFPEHNGSRLGFGRGNG